MLTPLIDREKLLFVLLHIKRAYSFIAYLLEALFSFFIEHRRVCYNHISNWLERGISAFRNAPVRYLFSSRYFMKGRRIYILPEFRPYSGIVTRFLQGKEYPPTPYLGQFAACTHQRNYVERDYNKHRQKPNTHCVDRKWRAH